MPTTQLLGSVGHVGSTWNTGMPADFAALCAAPGSTQRATMAITISPSHAHRIIVFRIHAPFIKERGATTLESIYLPVFGVGPDRICLYEDASECPPSRLRRFGRASSTVAHADVVRRAGPNQRGPIDSATRPAVHDDAGGDVQAALADCLPARWTHAHHREGRPDLAGDATGAEDGSRKRSGGVVPRARRHAGRLRVAALRHRSQRLSHVLGTRRRRLGPGARTRTAESR